jgi:hypothetical protein
VASQTTAADPVGDGLWSHASEFRSPIDAHQVGVRRRSLVGLQQLEHVLSHHVELIVGECDREAHFNALSSVFP